MPKPPTSTTFSIGQRVTCTDVSGLVATHNERFPVKGQVYTIRSIITDPSGSQKCLRLKEIVNSIAQYKDGTAECAFKASRFAIKKGR